VTDYCYGSFAYAFSQSGRWTQCELHAVTINATVRTINSKLNNTSKNVGMK